MDKAGVPIPGDLSCGSISPDPALFLLGALAGPCNPAVGAGPGDGEWIKQAGYNPSLREGPSIFPSGNGWVWTNYCETHK